MTSLFLATAGFATLTLGLAAGALLAEGAVFVPYWRSLPAEAFLRWYREHASLLVRFFGALEVVSTGAVLLAAVVAFGQGAPGRGWMALSAALAVAVLASFPLYFQKANASFAEATIEPDAVAAELARWAAWHWGRTAVATASFAAAAFALTG